jgi:hypothetical protein
MKLRRLMMAGLFVAVCLLGTSMRVGISIAQVQCGVLPQSVCDAVIGTPGSAPVTNASDAITPLVKFVTNILIGVIGLVAMLVIIISGVQISASAGNEEVVKKAKENIYKVVTGLILLISFRAIFELITRAFKGVSTTDIFTPEGNLNRGGIPLLLANVIGIASLAAGVVAVIFIIVGGIQYIGSGGGDGLVKAKKTITYAVSGLVIAILAYTIVSFISSQLQ